MFSVFKEEYIGVGSMTKLIAYDVTKRGWLNEEIFCMRFKKRFLPNIPSERPAVLLFDSHVSHITFKLIKTAVENNNSSKSTTPHDPCPSTSGRSSISKYKDRLG